MNKLLLSAALVSAVAGAALAPRSASASDGLITINGTITATSCTITAGTGGNVTVNLPTISNTSIATKGSSAGRTAFTIALSGCGTLTKATTYFESSPLVMTDGNLKNSATTGASTGTEVQLLNGADSSIINLTGGTGSQNVTQATISGGTATLPYYAQYFASVAGVPAGTVASTITYVMSYQ